MSRSKFCRSRLALLVAVLIVAHAILLWRLADLQLLRADELREHAERQYQRLVKLDPIRGPILDRNGHELALSVEVFSVYADPSEVRSAAAAARALARALDVEEADLRNRLRAPRYFVWVKRKITNQEKARVEALHVAGVGFIKESQRFYPKQTLAAHLLGHVGLDNDGQAGIEYSYDSLIRGQAGLVRTLKNGRGEGFYSEVVREPTGGAALTLTVDEVLQHLAERELAEAVRSSDARWGSAVILDPRTGAVLALANVPTYDPNQAQRSRPEACRNRAIADAYEPGSTFKVFTAAAALEAGVSKPSEWIYCQNGSIQVARRTVRDHKRFGTLTFAQVLEQSSNVGMIKVGLRLPPQRFFNTLTGFGFGAPGGVDLPGESHGLLHRPAEWSGLTQAMMSMGQEIGVTPLQLASAMAVVANGGTYHAPYLVERVVGRDGQTLRAAAHGPGRRVLSPATAASLRRILQGVVLRGTGVRAAVPGYRVAGKTGTAQQIDASGRYSARDYVASFVGWAPADSPALLILVAVSAPRGAYHGGEVAAPVFSKIALPALQYLRVPPDSPQPAPNGPSTLAALSPTLGRASARLR
jgi:cell division protein FtsI (penicillin-binding protein 3)